MKKFSIVLSLLFTSLCIFGQSYSNGTVFGNYGYDVAAGSAIDSEGSIYTVGLFQTSLTLDTTTINNAGGNADGFLTKHDVEGNPVWVKRFGGASDNSVIDIEIDKNDYIYLTGYFQGSGANSFDADPGTEEFLLAQLSFLLSRDCFIIKLDPNGDLIWAKQVSNTIGLANEDASVIKVDDAGNVYIGGAFLQADFNPDPVDEELIMANNDGANSSDGFILKLNSEGEFEWVKTIPATDFTKVLNMDLDIDNNIYIAGEFMGTIDLDPSETGTDEFDSNGGFDAFVIKLDSLGEYVWGNTFGSANNDILSALNLSPSGLYVGGYFTGTTDFDPGIDETIVSPEGDADGFLSKFDTDGNFQFVYPVGSNETGLEKIDDIKETNGNIVTIGSFMGQTDFDYDSEVDVFTTAAGGSDVYLLEISTMGEYLNHVTIGGTENETAVSFELFNDKVTFCGTYESSEIDLDPFSGEDIYNVVGGMDVFLSTFTTSLISSNDEFVALDKTSIFPNPATDKIFLDGFEDSETYSIYTILGNRIKSGKLDNSEIHVEDLNPGIYILSISTEDGKMINKEICISK